MPCTTSGQETERVSSYNPGARTGPCKERSSQISKTNIATLTVIAGWLSFWSQCQSTCKSTQRSSAVVTVWFCEAGGGAHLTKPGWSKPHTHSNSTNLALFRHKITLYRFNQGGLILLHGLKWEQGAETPPPEPPHFNHCHSVYGRCNQQTSSVQVL